MTDIKLPPLVQDYRVGLIVPLGGINAVQVGYAVMTLRQIVAIVGRYNVKALVPGFEYDKRWPGLQPEVKNLTTIGVQVQPIPMHNGSASSVRSEVEIKGKCDEVWCFPDITQRGSSKARANAVYKLGVVGPCPTRYKVIPPWVIVPVPAV